MDGFASDRFLQENQIGPGDELFLPGLFSPHKEESRNIPIIRTGTIAAMNEEPVPVELPGKIKVLMDAYLAECRSIGGLSGSPVFVTPGLVRFVDVSTALHHTDSGSLHFVAAHRTASTALAFAAHVGFVHFNRTA